jgi:single-strand DNA-binding protein
MASNVIIVSGNVVSDPVLRSTGNGRIVTNVRVASNEDRLNQETRQWETVSTSFYNVSCWQALGERVAASIRRGDAVFFVGRPTVREFKRDSGNLDHSVDVSADLFGPDLRRASVSVSRKQRSAATEPANGTSGQSPEAEESVDPWGTNVPTQPVPVSEPAA